jgi:hypothetical protein
VQAVQSLGGYNKGFETWFDALDWMKSEMDKEEYDIALIGCGAYGFPLAAHAKRTGHQAVHLGGALQLLFGIRGKRWEKDCFVSDASGRPIFTYSSLFNPYWVRPSLDETPQTASSVEGATYW